MISASEFQVLAHQVSQVCSNFDLHDFWDGSDRVVVNKQVFLQGGLNFRCL